MDELLAEIDALLGDADTEPDSFPWCDAYDSSTDPPAPTYRSYLDMLAAVFERGEEALPYLG